ncbi:UNVERIFIED_CONTAM: Pentatricopeptide repeat-containing protein [Sesamum angustifolium]|uniref:Pentatricopeptide repeat-containing protein n=1 Tax=Sesamum angustifolium TaxID=2727405 RepID=A0AAW2RHM9_9LAMI
MPKRDEFTWNTMVAGYADSGRIVEARKLLDETPKKSAITWSSIVSGYCKMGCEIESLQLFYEMQHEGCKPSQFTLGSVLRLCSIKGLLSRGEQIHGYAVKTRFDKDVFVVTGLIDVYAKCLHIVEAEDLFRSMSSGKNHVTWTAMINGYSQNGVLSACAAVSALVLGTQVHGCIVRGGFGANIFVQSAMVDMYTNCGDLGSAWKVVQSMEVDDVISWNAMIVGCARQGFPEQALSLFKMMHEKHMELDEFTYPSVLNSLASTKDMTNDCLIFWWKRMSSPGHPSSLVVLTVAAMKKLLNFFKMRRDGIDPDHIVVSSALSSCAELALLDLGNKFMQTPLNLGLTHPYPLIIPLCHCMHIVGAWKMPKKVFKSMEIRNLISWTALIVGYAQNGEGIKSLQFYDEMIASGVKPDFITFIGLLFACSHTGLTERGRYYFESMIQDYAIKPGPDHYACMIDLLGRAGKIQEAELLNKMEVLPDASVWKALLAACRIHGNVDLAKKAATALFELDPQDSVPYVILSNIYSATGKWEEAASVRRLMKSRGVSKEPGRSWIEMNGKVHTFTSEDRSHPDTEEIYFKVDEMITLIKAAGYVPDMNFALHDVSEEAKVHGLAYHSEKLAVAFGLLHLPVGAPIRIYKNIRVCGDCHTAMKFISRVYNRHIILRDSNRFHHFKEGTCSCADYW